MTARRKLLLAVGAGALAAPLASFAQQPTRIVRIGYLGPISASAPGMPPRIEAFRAGLRDFGYTEGKNIVIEFRWAEGKYERLPKLAADLVRLKVEVIVTQATPATRAAMQATSSIPIVAFVGDPVAAGLVGSLARPGGNLTGFSIFTAEVSAKRLELLWELLPRVKRVAVFVHPENALFATILQAMEAAAAALKIELHQIPLRRVEEIEGAFAAMRAKQVDAVVVVEEQLYIANARTIAEHSAKARLPSCGFSAYADEGGLVAYGVNPLALYRRAGYFVDKILKGAKPADLPFERATKFEFAINLKTAKALGVAIPQQLLLRADKVIE